MDNQRIAQEISGLNNTLKDSLREILECQHEIRDTLNRLEGSLHDANFGDEKVLFLVGALFELKGFHASCCNSTTGGQAYIETLVKIADQIISVVEQT